MQDIIPIRPRIEGPVRYYVTRGRAKEVATSRGIARLPQQGREILTVRAGGLPDQTIGQDEHGYYIDYDTGILLYG